jgi:sugar/nucleoside kinase (ribokinase family)
MFDRDKLRLRPLAERQHDMTLAEVLPLDVRSTPGEPFDDPQLAQVAERIGLFRHVILKPNAREATRAIYPERAVELDRAGVETCGAELARRNGRPVFLTLGADGVVVFHAGGSTHIPACPVRGPTDIVGAGDSTMAGIVAALCSSATLPEAAFIGNLAASVTIHQIGTTGAASRAQISACFTNL